MITGSSISVGLKIDLVGVIGNHETMIVAAVGCLYLKFDWQDSLWLI